jgi:hypothetical protein
VHLVFDVAGDCFLEVTQASLKLGLILGEGCACGSQIPDKLLVLGSFHEVEGPGESSPLDLASVEAQFGNVRLYAEDPLVARKQ